MIGKLKGRIDSTGEDWVMLDVGGVVYFASASARTLASLPRAGEAAELHTEMLVSQDNIRLIGFASNAEKEWFKLLQSVQGVGARVALAVLSIMTPNELASAIAVQDKAKIGEANGVGKKLAERIVLELKDKVPKFIVADVGLAQVSAEMQATTPTAVTDAVSALVNLGYGQTQGAQAVSAALKKLPPDTPPEKLIRAALKELATV
ncbi:Holliday junction branch migration protein RuvA [Aestuariivirga litoralis]|uniref:Holliday junction branch migration protein RuvA n=1 Tax=Aestuariivirga litoralis TaxID=2650924 RepID=UPI0018C69EA0|nr:Holliday junction branch migration protein RuvA [Aestuariivirga litoralis]MBG1230863.1 Holliday junction branch migration protein RuvA [Aestuariivirga litoralis]